MVLQIESKLTELPPLQEITFLCDTSSIEEQIQSLGEIMQRKIPSLPEIPDYGAFQNPIVVDGKKGDKNREFASPRGVATSDETGNIYVADRDNNRIQIFAENGDYINQFEDENLEEPWGVLIHQNYIYVTDCIQQASSNLTWKVSLLKNKSEKKEVGSISSISRYCSPCHRTNKSIPPINGIIEYKF